MKKLVFALAATAMMFSVSVTAHEKPKNKKKAKTEKSCSTEQKKDCTAGEMKKGCCAKKAEAKS